jgi:hypothetical protein
MEAIDAVADGQAEVIGKIVEDPDGNKVFEPSEIVISIGGVMQEIPLKTLFTHKLISFHGFEFTKEMLDAMDKEALRNYYEE